MIICTYNGGQNLPETLAHLSRQQVKPDLQWEIKVIDNASTDDTSRVAAQVWAGLGSAVRFGVVQEPRPGKNNAVDRGLQQARFGYVLVCDDDNWLDEHYVQTAFDIMSANPRIGVLGGRGIPVFEEPPPPWFNQFANYYAVGPQNPVSGEVTTSKGFLWGAGAVINKAAYVELLDAGFRRIITYERYRQVARGEDVELCLAIRLTGYRIWYDERLTYRHFINCEKLQWDYVLKLTREGGLAGPLVRPYQVAARQQAGQPAPNPGWLRWVWQRNKRGADLVNWLRLLRMGHRAGDPEYQRRLANHYYFVGLLRLGAAYNGWVRQVERLRANLAKPGVRVEALPIMDKKTLQ